MRMSKTYCTFFSTDYDGGFWAGYWDEPEEGVWTDVSTGRPLAKGDFTAWFAPHAEPNGDRLENCAVVWSARKAWNDYSCSWRYCTYCELERVPDVQIRGSTYMGSLGRHLIWLIN